MFTLVIWVMIIASVLMVGAVLVQKSKGGGLNQSFAGQAQLMGVRKSTDFIEKATWGLAISMLVFSLAAVAVKPSKVTMTHDSIVDEVMQNNRSNMQSAPAFDASQQQQPEAPAETPAAE
ncbi:MAG: preprotein translocase subunit SecG [Bacteroidales bacterium]|nr:preprotein translocase subunit SecG [Bacteroidales bacterium]